MKRELDEALVKDFPMLYRDRYADMRTTAMCWGFECGDGWEPLIRDLSAKITRLAKLEGIEVHASQIKEKYGTLRFYTTNSSDLIEDIIAYAEHRSAYICEVCGKDGELNDSGWLSVRCEECRKGPRTTEGSLG